VSVLRVRYVKLGRSRWIGHLDLARCWERAVRRAGIAARYSEGFSAHLRLAFGAALPAGAESVAEYLDVELTAQSLPAPELRVEERWSEALSEALPEGLDVCGVVVAEGRLPSLQSTVSSVEWRLTVEGQEADDLAEAAERLVARESIVVARQRKGVPVQVDIRPSLRRVEVLHEGTSPSLWIEAAAAPVTLRPGEVAEAMGFDGATVRCLRLAQWIEQEGRRWAPEELCTRAPAVGVQVGAT
jgi:radical SAM-linked protein